MTAQIHRMNRFKRFTTLATLVAFLGLSALEAFHTHSGLQTEAHCSVCQIAHKTPAHITSRGVAGPHWIQSGTPLQAVHATYEHFFFVAHGLSPPVL